MELSVSRTEYEYALMKDTDWAEAQETRALPSNAITAMNNHPMKNHPMKTVVIIGLGGCYRFNIHELVNIRNDIPCRHVGVQSNSRLIRC